MKDMFTVAELLRLAVDEERIGARFYDAVAARADDPQLRRELESLAGDERRHQEQFERLLDDSLREYLPREDRPGEYLACLRTRTNHRYFADEQTALAVAEQCRSDAEAVEQASAFERDTLMLMNEIRQLIPAEAGEIIEELTREEQAHLVTLAGLRKRLAAGT